MYVWLNGKILPEKEAKISALDRGFLVGEGVFTTMLLEEGKIPFFSAHLQRLKEHAQKIGILCPEITLAMIRDLACANKAETGVFRLRATVSATACLLMLQKKDPPSSPFRLTVYPEGIQHPLSRIKTLCYLERFFLLSYAKERGFDDCVTLNPEGYVLEASFANLFWMKGRTLFYPARSLPYLFGISLSHILQAAQGAPLSVEECLAKPGDLRGSSLYLCNCIQGFQPVRQLEGVSLAESSPHEEKLKSFFEALKSRLSTSVD